MRTLRGRDLALSLAPTELADGLALYLERIPRITTGLAPTNWVPRSPVRHPGDSARGTVSETPDPANGLSDPGRQTSILARVGEGPASPLRPV
jgi:hypothetical protein